MQLKLVVVRGETDRTEYSLELPVVIGRSRKSNMVLTHPLVSRRHCELFEADGQVMVRDLGSLNGTYLGKQRVATEAELTPGALLTVGGVTFRAAYDAPQAGPVNGAMAASHPSTIENQRLSALPAEAEALAEPVAADQPAGEEELSLDWLEEPIAADEPAQAAASLTPPFEAAEAPADAGPAEAAPAEAGPADPHATRELAINLEPGDLEIGDLEPGDLELDDLEPVELLPAEDATDEMELLLPEPSELDDLLAGPAGELVADELVAPAPGQPAAELSSAGEESLVFDEPVAEDDADELLPPPDEKPAEQSPQDDDLDDFFNSLK